MGASQGRRIVGGRQRKAQGLLKLEVGAKLNTLVAGARFGHDLTHR